MIGFRADGNLQIGTGHVMRCLSIAETLRIKGAECLFILADDQPAKIIREKGFDYICLNTVWNDMESEIDCLLECTEKLKIRTLVIDGYYVTERYLKALGERIKLVYIDDLNSFPYPVDLLVNYSIYAKDIKYSDIYKTKGIYTDFALGCDYVPLRKEFTVLQHVCREKVKKILITTGGTDQYNVAGRLLEYFKQHDCFCDLEFFVVIGKYNTYKSQLEEKWGCDHKIHLLFQVTDMAQYMRESDVAITAGGVTVYELLACGVPSVVYTLADNQLFAAKKLESSCLMPYAGDVRNEMERVLNFVGNFVSKCMSTPDYRRKVSKRMQTIVDGRGSYRLAEKILQLTDQ